MILFSVGQIISLKNVRMRTIYNLNKIILSGHHTAGEAPKKYNQIGEKGGVAAGRLPKKKNFQAGLV